MNAIYIDEYGDNYACILLNGYNAPMAFIELEGEQGTCSWDRIEISEVC